MVGIIPFEQPPQPPERPDFRRVTENADFKKLPQNIRMLIESELLRYDDALNQSKCRLADSEEKIGYVRAGLSDLTERLR